MAIEFNIRSDSVAHYISDLDEELDHYVCEFMALVSRIDLALDTETRSRSDINKDLDALFNANVDKGDENSITRKEFDDAAAQIIYNLDDNFIIRHVYGLKGEEKIKDFKADVLFDAESNTKRDILLIALCGISPGFLWNYCEEFEELFSDGQSLIRRATQQAQELMRSLDSPPTNLVGSLLSHNLTPYNLELSNYMQSAEFNEIEHEVQDLVATHLIQAFLNCINLRESLALLKVAFETFISNPGFEIKE